MQPESLILGPLALGVIAGALAAGLGYYLARRERQRALAASQEMLQEARLDAESKQKEILVAAHEQAITVQDEAERRERDLDGREAALAERARTVQREASELARDKQRLERTRSEAERAGREASELEARAAADHQAARDELGRIAGLTVDQARAELIADIEQQARRDASRLARKIEDEAREQAERRAVNLMIQASQRVNIKDVVESTVSFIELPSDEMKGRIIGREGRNIRALEMATGIDLVVDDTPRSILISSFDPVRREIAHVAIDRLVEDGRIHPARIEEVVKKVAEEFETLVQEKGTEAAYGLGISDLHPRLIRLVGEMRYRTSHGQNLLQHCNETAIIAAHMAAEAGAQVEVAKRAGLLHEVAQVDEASHTHPALASAEILSRFGETEAVAEAVRSLHPDVEATTVEAMLIQAANRMSENRPGARKENLAVFVERLKRLESIATDFEGVERAFAVKSGKEIRVIVDASRADDRQAHKLCREIARTVERELNFPGQIKVAVVRETRAVRFAV